MVKKYALGCQSASSFLPEFLLGGKRLLVEPNGVKRLGAGVRAGPQLSFPKTGSEVVSSLENALSLPCLQVTLLGGRLAIGCEFIYHSPST